MFVVVGDPEPDAEPGIEREREGEVSSRLGCWCIV